MQFTTRKRRQPPAIIIISLIDILIVLLIFLMVTTTFKRQPSIKLALPESRQIQAGQSENQNNLLVTVAAQEPFLYLETRAITFDRLEQELRERAARNPEVSVSIHGDKGAPWEQIVKVMDAARSANIRKIEGGILPAGQK